MRPASMIAPLVAVLSLVTAPALAHVSGSGRIAGGLASGFLHPVLGYDHVLAMLAVGMWGAQLGGRAIWALPVVFPTVMAAGGALGIAAVPFPAVELGIALSVLVLGGAIALAVRPPLWLGAVIVGTLAVFHGYAHGAELPGSADPVAYAFGFVAATGTVHAGGIALGLAMRVPHGAVVLRGAGALIGTTGAWLLVV